MHHTLNICHAEEIIVINVLYYVHISKITRVLLLENGNHQIIFEVCNFYNA